MAEIIRTTSVTTKASTLVSQPDETTSVEYVTVRSFTEDRFSVGGLFDFAQALRDAGAPDRAPIEVRKSQEGHVIELSTKYETPLPDEPTPSTTA